jgi:hypothetical protein
LWHKNIHKSRGRNSNPAVANEKAGFVAQQHLQISWLQRKTRDLCHNIVSKSRGRKSGICGTTLSANPVVERKAVFVAQHHYLQILRSQTKTRDLWHNIIRKSRGHRKGVEFL